MSGYNVIAGVYDSINAGIDYEKWGDRIEAIFREYAPHGSLPTLLLDLACGTGRMTLTLARLKWKIRCKKARSGEKQKKRLRSGKSVLASSQTLRKNAIPSGKTHAWQRNNSRPLRRQEKTDALPFLSFG